MTLAEKPSNFRRSVRRLIGRLRPERTLLGVVLVLGAVGVTCNVLGPKLLGNATNIIFQGILGEQLPPGVTQQQAVEQLRAQGEVNRADMVASMTLTDGVDFDALAVVIALVTVLYAVASLFTWGQQYLMAGITQRAMYALRRDVDRKLGRLPLSYFDRHARGDLLSRVTNDIDNLSTTLQQTLTQALTSLLTVIGVLTMMIFISPLLAGISLLVVPLSFIVTVLIARRSQHQFAGQWRWTGELNSHVEETFSGHDIVKLFGHRDRAEKEFLDRNDELYASSLRAQFISGIIQPAMMFIGNLNYVAIAIVGGTQVATGSISLGDVQAFFQYSRQFTMPITQLASVTNLLQSGMASAERIFELLDEPEQEPESNRRMLGRARGQVAMRDVSFRYDRDKPLIEDLNIDVAPGESVAIVGPTGAGKTTLVNLLMRFYEVDRGRIEVDGIDIRDLPRDELRRVFGMVLQDTWLFTGTIRENIEYGAGPAQRAAGVTQEMVLEASRAAHVDHFVRTLPDGYDTVLDDSASNVSAGERQLLTIARAFLSDPAILILDEATSSVDTRTEVLIQQAMAQLRVGRTSFVIAHRLSTIRDAHTILVMDAGHIIEQGTHEELLDARGFYHDLFMSQFTESFDAVADDRNRPR